MKIDKNELEKIIEDENATDEELKSMAEVELDQI